MASASCVAAVRVDGAHGERMDDVDLGAASRAAQVFLAVVVHQEADRAAVHAVDRHAGVHVLVQRLQHQPVAAERDDGVGRPGLGVAVARSQPLQGLAGLGHVAGDERDFLEVSRYISHVGSDPSPVAGVRPLAADVAIETAQARATTPSIAGRLAQLRANNKPVLIYSSFHRGEAERVGGAWWTKGLAARVNIFPGMTAIYVRGAGGSESQAAPTNKAGGGRDFAAAGRARPPTVVPVLLWCIQVP